MALSKDENKQVHDIVKKEIDEYKLMDIIEADKNGTLSLENILTVIEYEKIEKLATHSTVLTWLTGALIFTSAVMIVLVVQQIVLFLWSKGISLW